MTFLFAIANLEARKRQKVFQLKTNRNIKLNICVLRLPDVRFVKLFRVDKDTFRWILRKVKPHFTVSHLSPSLQLAAVLRFLATGSYQLILARDRKVNIGRSTFSRILHSVIPLMEQELCETAITLQMSQQQITESREHFYENYHLPRVVACVDGMQIRILKPVRDEAVYFNDKEYYSLNVKLVCNYDKDVVDGC